MVPTPPEREGPDWDALYTTAQAQSGHFTTAQAASAGYSPPLLHKHLANGRISRVRRGVYRVVHFPSADHEDLVVLWLWSDRAGVFSHETALALHDLSDVLPSKAHMTVPESWRQRRLRIPNGMVLHYGDVERRGPDWVESIPLTSPQRTIRDCIDADGQPDMLRQAIRQAQRRGLISPSDGRRLARELSRGTQRKQ